MLTLRNGWPVGGAVVVITPVGVVALCCSYDIESSLWGKLTSCKFLVGMGALVEWPTG